MRSEKEGIFVLVSEIKDELENMDAVAESLACLQGKIRDAAASDRKYLLESAGFELQAERILPLIKKLPETRKEFRKDMEEFLGFLKSIAV